MKRNLRGFAAAGSLFLAMFAAEVACAQKQGGILKMYSPDSPASMSIHEEATVFTGWTRFWPPWIPRSERGVA